MNDINFLELANKKVSITVQMSEESRRQLEKAICATKYFETGSGIVAFWEGVPPKSTFQQRDRSFHRTANARLAFAQWQAILEKFAPKVPLEGALAFRLALTWPHTRETAKARDGAPVRKTTRPDGVNILKGVEDIMTSLGYWKDDNQLAVETVERWHGEMPGVLIEIRRLADE